MSQIVQLDSLGAPERLEVTARLLLDLREQLHPVLHPIKVQARGGGRSSGAAAAAAAAGGHMWKLTLYSLHENPAGELGVEWGGEIRWDGGGELCFGVGGWSECVYVWGGGRECVKAAGVWRACCRWLVRHVQEDTLFVLYRLQTAQHEPPSFARGAGLLCLG